MSPGYVDDKVQLPFTVTDLKGRNLQLVTGPHNGQVRVCNLWLIQKHWDTHVTWNLESIIRYIEPVLYLLQSVCVEQLTLDFEYLINEVIRSDAAWAPQFCSFSDYDVVILEVSAQTHTKQHKYQGKHIEYACMIEKNNNSVACKSEFECHCSALVDGLFLALLFELEQKNRKNI